MFRDEGLPRETTLLLPQGHQMPVVRCLVYLMPSPIGRTSEDRQEELPERKLKLATANININTRVTCPLCKSLHLLLHLEYFDNPNSQHQIYYRMYRSLHWYKKHVPSFIGMS